MIVYAHQNDTVDSICWRYFAATSGIVEQTLELNPGLVDYGPVLPHGTKVKLPNIKIKPVNKLMVKLWD